MVKLREVDHFSLDEESLHLAADVYARYRDDGSGSDLGWDEEYKWEVLSTLNEWHENNEITGENIPEMVELLREVNPSTGPLVNWRDLDELEQFATDDPSHLASLLESLYSGEGALAPRIEQFREAVNIGTPAIGYLLASYDMDRYPPYKDGMFRTFLAYFEGASGPIPTSMSVHEKYTLYLDYCESIKKLLETRSEFGKPTILDAQDFMYTIVEYDEVRNDYIINFLLTFADRLQDFYDDPLSIIDELRNLPSEFIRDRTEYYEGREKVARVRYKVLESILANEPIDLDMILKEEDARHEENIFQAWTDYKILAQPYLDFFKSRFERYLDDLGDYIVGEIGPDELDYHWVSYQGASNFPGTRSWMAIHPSNRSFRDAYQLFLDFEPGYLEIGLHSGSNLGDEALESRRITDDDEATISNVLKEFQIHKSEFDQLNSNQVTIDDEIVELDWFSSISRQIKQAKQMVFYGPPGTGKTFYAIKFAKWWVDQSGGDTNEQIRLVTFHPSYTYEDYLEGLTAEVNDGSLTYEIKPGAFKKFANLAREDWEENEDDAGRYVLIIDEINRGNLAKIFGETITLLERDKRMGGSSEIKVNLAHSGDSFGVPPNLYIIGTMNTADRSIALVDAALRRRFRFMEFAPDYKILFDEFNLESKTIARDVAKREDLSGLQALSVFAIQKLNKRILDAESLNKGKQIGHSYLMSSGTGEMGETELVDAWKHEILPLLDEYFFGQFDRLSGRLLREASDELLDENTNQIADFGVEELRTGLRSLVGEEIE